MMLTQHGINSLKHGDDTSVVIGGKVYPIVIINGVKWLGENLDFEFDGLDVDSPDISYSDPKANHYNNDAATYGYNGLKWGLLYNQFAVRYLEENKSVLIPGWHVATREEYSALATYLGGNSVAGLKIKATSGWSSGGNGDGTTDFNAPPAGIYRGVFEGGGNTARFWTCAGYSPSQSYIRSLDVGYSFNENREDNYKQNTVRLVKDS